MRSLLIVGALLAVAFAAPSKISSSSDRLKQLVETQIKQLEVQGKLFLAKELQLIEQDILKFELQLQSLSSGNVFGRFGEFALESIFKELEKRLQLQISKLTTTDASYYSSGDALKEGVNKLNALAQVQINKLVAQGKLFLAKELQIIQDDIVALEKAITSSQSQNLLGRLSQFAVESIVKQLEVRLQAQIQKLTASF